METKKTSKKTNTTIWGLLGLTALALFLFAAVDKADAAVRVSATVRTPYVDVRIGTGGPNPHVAVVRQPMPIRRHVEFRITERDERIARRLARYTGAERQELLRLRRQGYSWVEIGRWLDVPAAAVYAAGDQQAWRRYLKSGHQVVKCGTDYRRGSERNEHGNRGRGGDRDDHCKDNRNGRWDR